MKRTIKRYPGDVKAWWQSATDDVKWTKHDFDGGFYNQACQRKTNDSKNSLITVNFLTNIMLIPVILVLA